VAVVEEDTVWRALADIKDPCSIGMGKPVDIVSLGLVEFVSPAEDGQVTVGIVLTQPTCWFFPDISRYIAERLASLDGITTVDIEVVEELWVPERMTAGRKRLAEAVAAGGPPRNG
jgi:metal-sulfur cluster biosynthetic enzyme